MYIFHQNQKKKYFFTILDTIYLGFAFLNRHKNLVMYIKYLIHLAYYLSVILLMCDYIKNYYQDKAVII